MKCRLVYGLCLCLATRALSASAAGGPTTAPATPGAVAQKIDRAHDLLYTKDYQDGAQLLEDVITELSKVVQADRKDVAATFQLARALFFLERNREALTYIDRAMLLDPPNPLYHLYRGKILSGLDRLREAEDEMRMCVKLAPTNAEYHLALGRAKAARLDHAGALACFRKAMELEPKHAEPVFKAGMVLVSMGKEAEAIPLFQRAAELAPKEALPYHNLGQIYQSQGNLQSALDSFLTAVRLEPGLWRAKAKLVQVYQSLGKLDLRDAQRAELLKLRASGSIESLNQAAMYCRDQFTAGGRKGPPPPVKGGGDPKLMAFEHFELSGPRAVRYVFYVHDRKGEIDYRISLGSYEITNLIAREQGALKEGQRLFHLDLYRPGGHALYGMFHGEPSYDQVKAMVVRILAGDLQPVSSSTSSSRPATRPGGSGKPAPRTKP